MARSPMACRWRTWFAVVVASLVIVGAVFFWPDENAGEAPASVPGLAKQSEHSAAEVRPESVQPPAIESAAEGAASPPALFRFETPANEARLTASLPAPAARVHYVRVERSLFAGKASPFWQPRGEGVVLVPLPEGGELEVVIDESELMGVDAFVSRGHLAGRPGSRASFSYQAGFLHASFEDPARGTYALRVVTDQLSQFYRVDPDLIPACGGARAPVFGVDGPARSASLDPGRAGAAGAGHGPATAAADEPQRAEVHVLMLYTQDVLPEIAGSNRSAVLESAFREAINRVNTALENSRVSPRLRLVGVAETPYDERASAATSVQNDALTALSRISDGKMDEVHTLRDRVGADVVILALARTGESSGLAYVLDETEDGSNANFAFGVVQFSNIGGTHVVAHELGHLFGCTHHRDDRDSQGRAPSAGTYSFSYGYRFRAANNVQYRDIMAYSPGTQLAFFSNPDISAPPPAPANSPGGVPLGAPGESATAITIERRAWAVSTYRLQTQSAPGAGALINVATRAYVGTGGEVLIGGFVVRGGGGRQVLVRGVGPALGGFGVGDALTNPRLRLMDASGRELAANDDWGTQPNAAEIAAAAGAAGAFPLTAGSLDAALTQVLPEGNYTAIVEGAGGATGTGLVEVYGLEGGVGRIVNLATRGFADKGREMVGGFVVRGGDGPTKRILVRVLGPTLERSYGITGAMQDPFLELRGAGGQLLIFNDDWVTAARSTGGVRDDFQPLVRYYGEQQISGTGFAPTNRREPAILVDLPPGNYTAIVKPFELVSSNPALAQPPRPGVAIVEVYELP